MPASANSPQMARCRQTQNGILASLPQEDYDRLVPNLEPITLSRGKVLYHASDVVHHAYFINDGQVSLLSTIADGTSIEVAVAGHEGVIGIPLILRSNITAYEVMAQIPVNALRVRADVFKSEFERGGKLFDMMLRYTQLLLTQITQSVICNRFHAGCSSGTLVCDCGDDLVPLKLLTGRKVSASLSCNHATDAPDFRSQSQ